MSLAELLGNTLSTRAGKRALECVVDGLTRTFTFADIHARGNRMAHELLARGVESGDRLCLHIPNSVACIDLLLACARIGSIFVPINTHYRARELRHIISDARPRAVVVPRAGGADYPPGTELWSLDDMLAGAESRSYVAPSVQSAAADAAAVIVYTSGTTGASKGAVLSHSNLMANGRSVAASWRMQESDRYLAVLPLFHVHGLANGVFGWIVSGCTMRLEERFDYRRAAELFATFRPTLFFGVPTIYVRLLADDVIPPELAQRIGHDARLFVCGSAPLPSHVLEAFQRKFGHTILERYGMTESLMITTNPYDGERRAGSVGLPFPGVHLKVLGENGEPVRDGEAGEVHLRSPHLFQGYWRNPAATHAAFVDGYFRTGDVGVLSRDGYLTLRGRRSDVIISGGFNIYPREVEELILEDPRVREVAVVGLPDALHGEVPVACFVSEAPGIADHLMQLCKGQLAAFKVPRRFVRVDALPRNAMGKVLKHTLAETLSSAT